MADFVNWDVSLSSDFSATPQNVRDRTQAHTQDILARITSLSDYATSLRQSAEQLYTDAANLPSAGLPDARLDASLSAYSVVSLPQIEVPDKRSVQVEAPAVGDSVPTLAVSAFERSSISAPPVDDVSFPVPPSVGAAPGAPLAPDLPLPPVVPDAPLVDVVLPVLPTLPPIPTMDISLDALQSELVSPSAVTDDLLVLAPLDVDALTAHVTRRFVPNQFAHRLLVDVVPALNAYLQDGLAIPSDTRAAPAQAAHSRALNSFGQRLQSLWSRRGATPHAASAVSTYVARVAEREQAEFANGLVANDMRLRMQTLPGLFQTAVDVHSTLANIKENFYALEVEQAVVEHTAAVQLRVAAAEMYRNVFADFRTQSAMYEQRLVQMKADVDAFLMRVRQQLAVAGASKTIASAYEAKEAAKVALVASYEAKYRAAYAAIEAYSARIRAFEVRAKTAAASLAQFDAKSQQWYATLTSVKADFAAVRAKNQAVVAQNQLLASQVTTSGAQAENIAAEAAAAATDVAVQVASLKAAIAQRQATYAKVEHDNTVSTLLTSAQTALYQREATEFSASTIGKANGYRNDIAINRAVTSTASAIIQAAINAAQTTQRNRVAYAEAYEAMYRTLADAEAAKVAGQASALRADVRLSARGDVSYDSSVARRVDDQYSATASKATSYVTLFTKLTE